MQLCRGFGWVFFCVCTFCSFKMGENILYWSVRSWEISCPDVILLFPVILLPHCSAREEMLLSDLYFLSCNCQ